MTEQTMHAHAARSPSARRGMVTFLRQYARNPAQIGAVSPSSRHLAKVMLEGTDIASARVVVEYGPGSGAFTGAILAALSPNARFFAVEANPAMAAIVRERHPSVRVHHRSVAAMREICRNEGLEDHDCVDVIVSGLPWASFSDVLQKELLDATLAVLRPGGVLATFAYTVGLWTPAGRRFARVLPQRFTTVERSRTVLRNLPPAFVYRCRK